MDIRGTAEGLGERSETAVAMEMARWEIRQEHVMGFGLYNE